MQELDFRAIIHLLLMRIKWIILGFVAGAVLFGAYASLFMPEKYTSTAMIYVINLEDNTSTNAATTGNLSASERLVKTVRTAATATWALESASSRLNKRVSAGTLGGATAFSTVEDTSFLRISVTLTDPRLAQEACNTMAQTAVDAFAATGEKGAARLYQEATVAGKTSPNITRNTVLGAVIGAVLSIAAILLSALMNNTVAGKEELARRIDMPILGEIPSLDIVTKGGRK